MILGFAHLTVSTVDPAAFITGLGRKIHRQHLAIPSHAAKHPLLSRPAAKHDLILLDGTPVIEVIRHDTGVVSATPTLDFDMDRGEILMQASDMASEQSFLTAGLAAAERGDSLVIRGIFPTWGATIRLRRAEKPGAPPPLDVDGYSCIAFYSSDPAQDRDRLLALGGYNATETFGITLDGQRLEVLMLRSPNGTIVELVKVIRR